MKVTYNVIWADDDTAIYNQKDQFIKHSFDKDGIKLLDTATNAEELEDRLKKWEGMVDAVIIDANFSRSKSVPNTERDISGLRYCVMNLLRTYGGNGKKIPFFLYTMRQEDELRKACEDGEELKYFDENGHLFFKNQSTSILFKKIKARVDELNTPEFQIRNKYRKGFEAAALIPEATRLLTEGLLYEFGEYENKEVQDYFNPARKLLERIVNSCKEKGILPPLNALNSVGKYLSEGKAENYSVKDASSPIMPKPLAYSLKYYLGITQDGSHDKSELSLGVDSYVRERGGSHLFQAIIQIAMELLLWYSEIISTEHIEKTWESSYIYEGPVQQTKINGQTRYYCGNNGEYSIAPKEGLHTGSRVGIKNAIPIEPKYQFENVTMFVRKHEYDILD